MSYAKFYSINSIISIEKGAVPQGSEEPTNESLTEKIKKTGSAEMSLRTLSEILDYAQIALTLQRCGHSTRGIKRGVRERFTLVHPGIAADIH